MNVRKLAATGALFTTVLSFSATAQETRNTLESTSWDRERATTSIATHNESGSGYRDMEGSVVNYRYEDFGAFRIAIFDNSIKWRGFREYYTGMVSHARAQVSRVADGIYFYSWGTDSFGDNVVHNFNTMRVNAHLRPGPANRTEGEDFSNIHGEILCRDTPECVFPNGRIRLGLLEENRQRFNLPPLPEVERPLIEANLAARRELAGVKIVWSTPEGDVAVQVDGEETHVSLAGEEPQTYPTFATKIDDNIYFLSWWDGEFIGQHVMVNRDTMRAFDHVMPDGTRREAIYRITCFDTSELC